MSPCSPEADELCHCSPAVLEDLLSSCIPSRTREMLRSRVSCRGAEHILAWAWQRGRQVSLILRLRWESQEKSRAVSEMKTRAFCCFPSLFTSLFTGGRSINTAWYSSLVWQFGFQIITPDDDLTDTELQEQAEVSIYTSSELEEPGHSFLSRNWSFFSLSPP